MSDLNQKVLRYCRNHLNKKVDRGECWDLAFEALKFAGANTPSGQGSSLYRWSAKKIPFSSAKPGDIIQFFEYKIDFTEDDGGNWEVLPGGNFEYGRPRHTSILKAKKSRGQVEVYEQNMRNIKKVKINTQYLVPGTYTDSSLTVTVKKLGGRVVFYRPLKAPEIAYLVTPSSEVVPVFASFGQDKRGKHPYKTMLV